MPSPDRVVVPIERSSAAAAAAVEAALALHPRSRTVVLLAADPPALDTCLAALEACGPRAAELEAPVPPPASAAAALAGAGLRRVTFRELGEPGAAEALHAAGVQVSWFVDASEVRTRTGGDTLAEAVRQRPWLLSVTVGVGVGGALPDLGVLAGVVASLRRAAVEVNVRFGTEGIPACVGDPDGTNARHRRPRLQRDLQWGTPCPGCALRPVCVGAPSAWWGLPREEGPAAPEVLVEPWEHGGVSRLQSVVRGFGEPVEAALRAAPTPTVWLWTDRLTDAELRMPFTHLALELHQARIPLELLQRLRRVGRPVHVGLRMGALVLEVRAVLHTLERVGVHGVTLLAPESWADAELVLTAEFPALGIRRVGPPAE